MKTANSFQQLSKQQENHTKITPIDVDTPSNSVSGQIFHQFNITALLIVQSRGGCQQQLIPTNYSLVSQTFLIFFCVKHLIAFILPTTYHCRHIGIYTLENKTNIHECTSIVKFALNAPAPTSPLLRADFKKLFLHIFFK